MSFVWKVIFFIYNVFLIIFGGAVILLALGTRDYFSSFATISHYSTQNRMTTLTVGFALLLLALIMILIIICHRKKKLLHVTTDAGNKITIGMKAAQNMVLQSLLGIPGIREVTPEIQSNRKGILVRLHVTVEARQNIPSLCEEMQQRVKDHLVNVTGLKVMNVTLLVENVVPVKRTPAVTTNKGNTDIKNKKSITETKKSDADLKKKKADEKTGTKTASAQKEGTVKPEDKSQTIADTKPAAGSS